LAGRVLNGGRSAFRWTCQHADALAHPAPPRGAPKGAKP
jgi:hypothetical protein